MVNQSERGVDAASTDEHQPSSPGRAAAVVWTLKRAEARAPVAVSSKCARPRFSARARKTAPGAGALPFLFRSLGFLLLLTALPSLAQWNYPPTKTVDASDTYFGKTYPDPYRWLEDLKDKDVAAWFKAQAELTDGLLAKIPGRDALVQEWLALDKLKPAAYTDITYENGRVFYKKTLGGENVGKLYLRQGWNGAEKLLYRSGHLQGRGADHHQHLHPFVGRQACHPGADFRRRGMVGAAGFGRGQGSPAAGDHLPLLGALGWMRDNQSFFYDAGKTTDIKSLDIELNRKTRVHKLGADVTADRDVFSDESNPELDITPKESPNASMDESYPDYVVGSVSTVQNEMRIFYAPGLRIEGTENHNGMSCASPRIIWSGASAFHGDYVYAVTHTDAPKYKLVRTSVKHPDWAHAETVVPEGTDSILSHHQEPGIIS